MTEAAEGRNEAVEGRELAAECAVDRQVDRAMPVNRTQVEDRPLDGGDRYSVDERDVAVGEREALVHDQSLVAGATPPWAGQLDDVITLAGHVVKKGTGPVRDDCAIAAGPARSEQVTSECPRRTRDPERSLVDLDPETGLEPVSAFVLCDAEKIEVEGREHAVVRLGEPGKRCCGFWSHAPTNDRAPNLSHSPSNLRRQPGT
ncbi:MAG: hypothetical protein ACHQIG_03710 [Acidimicrobiia bacterium]